MDVNRDPPQWIKSYQETLSSERLEELARDHWRTFRERDGPLPSEDEVQAYVTDLLPYELAYAHHKKQAIQWQAIDTLVLLVGLSYEPLLQSVCVFRPKHLVLVLNHWYPGPSSPKRVGGGAVGDALATWIKNYLEPFLTSSDFDPPQVLAKDQPDDVFQKICDAVPQDTQGEQSVIVDITGGKKSMVAGAFLFAAYADIPISYVDFDEYDSGYRRPFGYTCRIGDITNPYQVFRLRKWESVQQLYIQGKFRQAAEVLEALLPAMKVLFKPDQVQAAQTLLTVLHFYEAWADGDHHLAQERLETLCRVLPDFTPPRAVGILGRRWPYAEPGLAAQEAAERLLDAHRRLMEPLASPPLSSEGPSICVSNELLLAYARDELAKIEILVETNEDNRSALLRAAGLDEFLLKTRWIRLWMLPATSKYVFLTHCVGDRRAPEESEMDSTEVRAALLQTLLLQHDDTNMRRALQQAPVRVPDQADERLGFAWIDLNLRKEFAPRGVNHGLYRLRPGSSAPVLRNYVPSPGLRAWHLGRLRDQAIHTYLYIPQEIARAALKIARANLKDFEDPQAHWLDLGQGTPLPPWGTNELQQIPWSKLRTDCELDFLPLISTKKGG